jgi:hypothetical protein
VSEAEPNRDHVQHEATEFTDIFLRLTPTNLQSLASLIESKGPALGPACHQIAALARLRADELTAMVTKGSDQ